MERSIPVIDATGSAVMLVFVLTSQLGCVILVIIHGSLNAHKHSQTLVAHFQVLV